MFPSPSWEKPAWFSYNKPFSSTSSLNLPASTSVYTLYKVGIRVTPLYSPTVSPLPFLIIGTIIPSFHSSGHPSPFYTLSHILLAHSSTFPPPYLHIFIRYPIPAHCLSIFQPPQCFFHFHSSYFLLLIPSPPSPLSLPSFPPLLTIP